MNQKVGVLHLVDSLAMGGTEHMAVMLANHLPQDGYRSYLCASRKAGPLESQIQTHVKFLNLGRSNRFDLIAINKLAKFVRDEHIQIIHAHSSSLFLAVVVRIIVPSLKLIWHDHYGDHENRPRPIHIYKLFARNAQVIFTVTRQLAFWSIKSLGIPQDRVVYMPNFVESNDSQKKCFDLPGVNGKRIICVANFRSQKDHLTLITTMSQVLKKEPFAHLLLVGEATEPHLGTLIREKIIFYDLEQNVTWLGLRRDVPSILENCDIGVLSSTSEGFPVVLLEYGNAGLSVVATNVGECAEILEDGEAGLLVPPSSPDSLSNALIQLLESNELQEKYKQKLKRRIENNYSADAIILKICSEYSHIIKC